MEYQRVDHIRIRASLVILLIDDYTNKVVNDKSVFVSIEGAAKPIQKSEGYYIFLNLDRTKVDLTIKSDRYTEESRLIDLSTINNTDPVLKIRVKPSRNYPLPEGTTSIQGVAEPLSEIRVVCDNLQKYYRLLYDYDPKENNEAIRVFNPEKTDLDGKVFLISDKDDNSEIFSIIATKDRENDSYHLEAPLGRSYKKAGTKISPIFITKADEKGEFFIPLWNLGEEPAKCECEMIGKEKIRESITLETGKVNRLHFNSLKA